MNFVEHGQGTPIVLLHGFDADHRLVTSLDAAFDDGAGVGAGEVATDAPSTGWRRLYPDLPGFGDTPIGDVTSTDDVVEQVLAFLDEQVGDEPFAILGDSFGGMIARAVTQRRREQVLGLGLLAAVFVADSDARQTPEQRVLREDDDALAAAGDAADDYAAIAVEQSVEDAERFLAHAAPGAKVADKEAMKRLSQNYALTQNPEAGEPFDRPSLIITGRQDHLVGYEDAWAQLEHYPRATFVTLDAAGHNAHLERPALVNALVVDWLARMRADQPAR